MPRKYHPLQNVTSLPFIAPNEWSAAHRPVTAPTIPTVPAYTNAAVEQARPGSVPDSQAAAQLARSAPGGSRKRFATKSPLVASARDGGDHDGQRASARPSYACNGLDAANWYAALRSDVQL